MTAVSSAFCCWLYDTSPDIANPPTSNPGQDAKAVSPLSANDCYAETTLQRALAAGRLACPVADPPTLGRRASRCYAKRRERRGVVDHPRMGER